MNAVLALCLGVWALALPSAGAGAGDRPARPERVIVTFAAVAASLNKETM